MILTVNYLVFTDEVDAFKCGSSESIPCNFKNILNEILIPYPEKCFAAFQSCGSQEETDGKHYFISNMFFCCNSCKLR